MRRNLRFVSGQQGIFLSSAAIKRTYASIDSRKPFKSSRVVGSEENPAGEPIHFSSNGGVSGQISDRHRHFITSRSRGIRGPQTFLKLSRVFAKTLCTRARVNPYRWPISAYVRQKRSAPGLRPPPICAPILAKTNCLSRSGSFG